MADWFAVYRESDGEALSYATDVPPLRPGIASTPIAGPPGAEVWNPSTLQLDPRPARLPEVDRVDDFLNDLPRSGVNFKEADIRTRLGRLLGDLRVRGPNELVDLP